MGVTIVRMGVQAVQVIAGRVQAVTTPAQRTVVEDVLSVIQDAELAAT